MGRGEGEGFFPRRHPPLRPGRGPVFPGKGGDSPASSDAWQKRGSPCAHLAGSPLPHDMNLKLLRAYQAKHGYPCEDSARRAIEAEVVATAGLFRQGFGYFDAEDIRQEAVILGLEALEDERYDPERSLAAFLYSHMKKRLVNLYRNTFYRSERPCRCCALDAEEPCE